MRARECGLVVGVYEPGVHNAITDVPGVRVGQVTVRRVPDVWTGVTAVVPDALPVSAGKFAGNGYGKLVGATQLAELGQLETPILLTATLSAFRAADALVSWMLARDPALTSINPVVGECNDGWLSDIAARPITADHVFSALDGAAPGPVAEGCVGAGTGTVALGFKAGIGTASRTLTLDGTQVTVGALVQANFGGTLRVHGRTIPAAPIGGGAPHAEDSRTSASPSDGEPRDARPRESGSGDGGRSDSRVGGVSVSGRGGGGFGGVSVSGRSDSGLDGGGLGAVVVGGPPDEGSCIVVLATDAAVDARQLARVARRGVFALARVGASYSHGSGDYAIAFSTAPSGLGRAAVPNRPGMIDPSVTTGAVPDAALSPLFAATLDVVEESVLNSLLAAVTTEGRDGRIAHAVDPKAW